MKSTPGLINTQGFLLFFFNKTTGLVVQYFFIPFFYPLAWRLYWKMSTPPSWICHFRSYLKTLDTIGNCQRPVFSLGVSQHINAFIKLQTCENLSSIGRRICKTIMKEKTPLSHEVVCFHMLDSMTSKSNSKVSESNLWKNYFFLENCINSEGAVSHHQPLPNPRYQVSSMLILFWVITNSVHCLKDARFVQLSILWNQPSHFLLLTFRFVRSFRNCGRRAW